MSELPMHGAVPDWTLGDRLARALRYAEMDNADMAAYLKVSRNTIGNYIAGRTKVSRGTVLAWALRTGVNPDWLEDGTAAVTHPQPPGPGVSAEKEDKLASLTEAKLRRTRRSAPTIGVGVLAA